MTLCGTSYDPRYTDFVCVDDLGTLLQPDYVSQNFRRTWKIPAPPHPLPRFEAQLRHDHAVLRLLAEGHPDLAGAQQLQFYRRHLHPLSAGSAPADGLHPGGKSAGFAGVDPNS